VIIKLKVFRRSPEQSLGQYYDNFAVGALDFDNLHQRMAVDRQAEVLPKAAELKQRFLAFLDSPHLTHFEKAQIHMTLGAMISPNEESTHHLRHAYQFFQTAYRSGTQTLEEKTRASIHVAQILLLDQQDKLMPSDNRYKIARKILHFALTKELRAPDHASAHFTLGMIYYKKWGMLPENEVSERALAKEYLGAVQKSPYLIKDMAMRAFVAAADMSFDALGEDLQVLLEEVQERFRAVDLPDLPDLA
jgi:cellobiose-specific phosphotransferase system component IIA